MGIGPVEDLRGSLAFTTVTDVLQFLNTTARTGELSVEGGPDKQASKIYFDRGTVYHAEQGAATGIDALVEIISWTDGTFAFSTDTMTPTVSIEVNLQNALVEAARRLDERRRDTTQRDNEQAPQRLLDAFAETSGVLAAVLMADSGVPVATANPTEAVDMGALGDGLMALIENVNGLGEAQGCRPSGGFFIEYDRFQILCLPVAGAMLVVFAPGDAQLGVIRHKTQHLADALAEVLTN